MLSITQYVYPNPAAVLICTEAMLASQMLKGKKERKKRGKKRKP